CIWFYSGFASGGPVGVSAWNNVCYDVEQGIQIGFRSTNLDIRNNIIANVLTPFTGDQSGHIVSNNLVNPDVNATFVNAGGNDFHLRPGSPAIDGGATVLEVTTDLEGTPRPQVGAYDIGAYEYR